MPRPPKPDDLYRLRVATEPRLSPDGTRAIVTLQTVAPGYDGYRQALWLVATDASVPPRRLTLGARDDRHPRFSPDGRILAFLSDRRTPLEEDPIAHPVVADMRLGSFPGTAGVRLRRIVAISSSWSCAETTIAARFAVGPRSNIRPLRLRKTRPT